ncbi:hypothetical protein CL658_01990 [bacterium]|nr:hypothetical protein [bacterium]
MNYIIDAYNLIGKLNNISLSDSNKEETLIQLIKQLEKNTKDYFILIFDGKNKETPFQSTQNINQIKIIFTDTLESADEYIIRFIKTISNKKTSIIVSSDNEIKYKCKKHKLTCINSESFFRYHSKQKKTTTEHDYQPNKTEINYWLNKFNTNNKKK